MTNLIRWPWLDENSEDCKEKPKWKSMRGSNFFIFPQDTILTMVKFHFIRVHVGELHLQLPCDTSRILENCFSLCHQTPGDAFIFFDLQLSSLSIPTTLVSSESFHLSPWLFQQSWLIFISPVLLPSSCKPSVQRDISKVQRLKGGGLARAWSTWTKSQLDKRNKFWHSIAC